MSHCPLQLLILSNFLFRVSNCWEMLFDSWMMSWSDKRAWLSGEWRHVVLGYSFWPFYAAFPGQEIWVRKQCTLSLSLSTAGCQNLPRTPRWPPSQSFTFCWSEPVNTKQTESTRFLWLTRFSDRVDCHPVGKYFNYKLIRIRILQGYRIISNMNIYLKTAFREST